MTPYIWRYRSTVAQEMAFCMTAPSRYPNQCWHIISEALWQSFEDTVSGKMWKISINKCVLILHLWNSTRFPPCHRVSAYVVRTYIISVGGMLTIGCVNTVRERWKSCTCYKQYFKHHLWTHDILIVSNILWHCTKWRPHLHPQHRQHFRWRIFQCISLCNIPPELQVWVGRTDWRVQECWPGLPPRWARDPSTGTPGEP